VVVETYVVVMNVGTIIAFVYILSSPIPCKSSNTNPTTLMIVVNKPI
jgi:hypothetical protein